jgi:hypothetical protein
MMSYRKIFMSFSSLLLLAPSLAFAETQTPVAWHARVELMKYVISEEAKHPVQTKWSDSKLESFFKNLELVSSAYAYRDGDVCIVLGFKSMFENGMCSLTKAHAVENYKQDCSAGELPCNPVVFGQAEGKGVFCVSPAEDKQLSKSCAFEAFSSVNKTTPIPGFDKVTRGSFNLDTMKAMESDPATASAFTSLFKSKNSSIAASIDFTKSICASISNSKKSVNQKSDVATCNSYLSFLEHTPATAAEATLKKGNSDGKTAAPMASDDPEPKSTSAMSAKSTILAPILNPVLAPKLSNLSSSETAKSPAVIAPLPCTNCSIQKGENDPLPKSASEQINRTVSAISQTTMTDPHASSIPSGTPFDGHSLYLRIVASGQRDLAKTKIVNNAGSEFLYQLSQVPGNLSKLQHGGYTLTGAQVWYPEGLIPHTEMTKPSAFPQTWKREIKGSDNDPDSAGASHIQYPSEWGIDFSAHPHIKIDFVNQTVTLPDGP